MTQTQEYSNFAFLAALIPAALKGVQKIQQSEKSYLEELRQEGLAELAEKEKLKEVKRMGTASKKKLSQPVMIGVGVGALILITLIIILILK